tara:strand:+ start:913 stop:1458 length:546 start_codon:yes stop_codon:yes gene_type:complete
MFRNYAPFLQWWWGFNIILLVTGIALFFNVHGLLWEVDRTKICYLILGIFYGMTIYCGRETWLLNQLMLGKITNLKNIETRHESGWFASEILLTLGLIGTVAGFILMLAGVFVGIDVGDVATVQQALSSMSTGMSTALYTTLAGLITSTILKLQYFRLGQQLENYRYHKSEILVEQMTKKN